jgi:hypothetical protein
MLTLREGARCSAIKFGRCKLDFLQRLEKCLSPLLRRRLVCTHGQDRPKLSGSG